ncbi:MAG: phosphoribosyltransferase [Cyanobacteria bacterium REEB67]|nr:phosphoribosyltransferase [Cyanobacteria bacterium REEB67]
MFTNRSMAGKQLAEKIDCFFDTLEGADRRSNLLVVGLPRGGVPVALEVARKFCCPLEIIVAKKLPYPGQPECAIGAVSSCGVVVLSPDVPKDYQWRTYIEGQRQTLLKQTNQAELQFYQHAGRLASPFIGKTVVVVDDGIATGMTAAAALESVKQRGAAYVLMAAPVMSREGYNHLSRYCDDVVALITPPDFRSVGQYYLDFEQTSDQEVINDLQQNMLFGPNPTQQYKK